MKNKIWLKLLIIFLILGLISYFGIDYLNRVILPAKIKSLIIESLKKQTQKEVTLESLQFNLFKGLVLKNLAIRDNQRVLISLKEASCNFQILPFFIGKGLIIPTLRLDSPSIFLERRPDNTFNLLDLLPKKATALKKTKFNVLAYSIGVVNGRIDFQDNYISPAFTKSIDNLNLNIAINLSLNLKFNLKANISASPTAGLEANGEFNIPKKELLAKINIRDLNLKGFSPYYQELGLVVNEGTIDSLINLTLKDSDLSANLEIQNKNLNLAKDKITAKLNSILKADLQYDLKNKQLSYSGNLDITELDLAGIAKIDKIDNIRGPVNFNTAGLKSEELRLEIFGINCQAKLNLTDFKSALLGINLEADLNLNTVQKIFADKFNIVLPLDLNGKGKLKLNLETKVLAAQAPKIEGVVEISQAEAKINKINWLLTNASGLVNFNLNQIRWEKLNFDYAGNTYSSNGTLENFPEPNLNLDLSSAELSLKSELKIKNKIINISSFKGKYLNSEFDLNANLNASSSGFLPSQISAKLNLNLQDFKKHLNKFKDIWEKINPQGTLMADLDMQGDIRDFKSWDIHGEFFSPSLSASGFSSQAFSMVSNLTGGIIDVQAMRLSLYDGIMEATANINLTAKDFPYLFNAYIEGVKIEKLKLDTPAKDKDIAGTLHVQTKLNGSLSDISQVSGEGKILITEGKLWQLNLLQGLGQLLFTPDFINIVFDKGYCDFIIKDKFILTDNLSLLSNLANLTGYAKIGFDSSLDASISIQMSNEILPKAAGMKDITSAILGQVGRVAVVKISGTLKQPKYKIQPAVMDVIKGLKDLLTTGKTE
jgi:hypothetical protein